MEKSWKF